MSQPNCIECNAPLVLPDDPMAGEILVCGDCGVELELLSLEPIQVGAAPEIEEDWGE